MLIQLTQTSPNKYDFYLESTLIIVVLRNPKNPLETNIITNLMTSNGPLIYSVAESPDIVASLINQGVPHAKLS